MLVLTRHAGQKIKIGDNVTITLCEIRGDRVRIGIEAPRDVTVNRAEVVERAENDLRCIAPPEPHE